MKKVFQTIAMTVKLLSVPVLLLSLIACGQNNDNNNNQQVAAVPYQVINGQCVNSQNVNQFVDQTYCQGQGFNQGFNNQGFNQGFNQGLNQGFGGGNVNGWQTSPYGQAYPYGQGYAAYFGANTYPSDFGGGSYSGTQSCVGQYYSNNGFTGQLRYCDGYSCRGLFLYSQSTRARVLCN